MQLSDLTLNNLKPRYRNHFHYLNENVEKFFSNMGLDFSRDFSRIVYKHGDKGQCYRRYWEEAGIHYYHGMMLLLLSYTHYAEGQVGETKDGWKSPGEWATKQYPKYKNRLPSVD